VVSPLLDEYLPALRFDLWVNMWREKWHTARCGRRYADDIILGFQHQADADRFLENLQERLGMLDGITSR